MLGFDSDQLRKIVKNAEPGNTVVAETVDKIDFLTFKDLENSVKQEVKYLQEHPLVVKETSVTGWIYDVRTGGVSRYLRFPKRFEGLNLHHRSYGLSSIWTQDVCVENRPLCQCIIRQLVLEVEMI
jgi:hypothetical protein